MHGPHLHHVAVGTKAGWIATSPTVFTSHSGATLSILHGSPAVLGRLFVADLRSVLLQKRVEKTKMDQGWTGAHGTALVECGIWANPVQRFLRSKHCAVHARYVVQAAWCGDYVTNATLHNWGYEISPNCTHCGELDSVHHRAYVCPFGQAAGNQLLENGKLKVGFLAEARLHPEDPLFARGWAAAPTWVKEASEDMATSFHEVNAQNQLVPAEPFQLKQSDGPIFIDGSTLHPQCDVLARSGYAMCQTTVSGELRKVIRGTV